MPIFFHLPLSQYIFQYGRFPLLSAAETDARLPNCGRKNEICPGFFAMEVADMGNNSGSFQDNFAIEKNPQGFLDSLGGAIRIAKEFGEGANKNAAIEGITHMLMELFPEGKIQFGISIFRHNPSLSKFFQVGVKKELKKNGRSSRCVNRGLQNLDGGTLHKEGFFTKNNRAEVLLFPRKNGGVIVGHTIAAQNVEEFAERDYNKPERDMVVGMLPPKVALILVNLSATNGALPQSIWDPFCGTGTVPAEAARLGIEVRGTDLSPEMVDAAQKNFLHLLGKEGEFFVHDATKLVKMTAKEFEMIGVKKPVEAEAIVSEGFLGPLFGKPITEGQYMNARKQVEPIMTSFLRTIAQEKSIKRIVICLPFWKLANGKNGFCKNTLAAAEKIWKNVLAQKEGSQNGLLYKRENQVVGRQILVLERR